MLVDGEINTEGKCSQAALTVAGLITYNIFQLTAQMKCIMTARVQYNKGYHHLSNLSYQRHTETS